MCTGRHVYFYTHFISTRRSLLLMNLGISSRARFVWALREAFRAFRAFHVDDTLEYDHDRAWSSDELSMKSPFFC